MSALNMSGGKIMYFMIIGYILITLGLLIGGLIGLAEPSDSDKAWPYWLD